MVDTPLDPTLLAQTRYLEKKNPFPFDADLRFEDEGHVYYARSPFTKNQWITSNDGAGIALPLISTTTIYKRYQYDGFQARAVRTWNDPAARLRMETDSTYQYFGCKSVEDILNKQSEPARRGTELHNIFEDLCNLFAYDMDHPDNGVMCRTYADLRLSNYPAAMYFQMFIVKFGLADPESGIELFRTELRVWDPVLHISGSIDVILYDRKNDSYIICDWKTSKKRLGAANPASGMPIEQLSQYSKGKDLESFKLLRNNDMNKYSIQQHVYMRMFENLTGRRVSAVYLVCIQTSKIGSPDAFRVVPVPIEADGAMGEHYLWCVDEMFQARAGEMLSQCNATLTDEHINALAQCI